jgi:Fe-S oxidoreductase
MIAHWQLDALVVTCGTCKSALASGEIEGLLNAKLQDAAQFLAEKGFRLPEGCDGNLYHAPCHDSLGGAGTQVLEQVAGVKISLSGRCCSEAGTMAMSRPDIAKRLRATKANEIAAVMGETGNAVSSVLTNCPSCLQGLSRQQNSTVKAEHIVVAWARALGGVGWKREFKLMLKNAERVNF